MGLSVKVINLIGSTQYLAMIMMMMMMMMRVGVIASLTSAGVLHNQVKGLLRLNDLKQLHCNTQTEEKTC